ncbi:acyl-CoA--6-aminopenicillanic acid acyl-transferase [Iocasia frigidifontis]|uniref:Acyl-CoA--6-aminopenicillanic acid acyl-transferase n=1 Tax=Iocasia fonsfrigidae TaxID=2682810 RepID=A0A8A7K7N0_9FIRM|nr:C45 family peptidase [Iocasia fonsfrigidae]QTL97793.1 acyl-CoA--6-aminopenicillanic acid acyl-transferase [Iocasia fonsfrigidae]
MYHPRLKGRHYEMGKKMGNVFKKYNTKFPINLDSFQIEFGKESGKLLKQYFPEAAAEIKGITDVIDYNNELFTAWIMCMGCCLDIDDGNSVEVKGCTAFSFMYNGDIYYARNSDLPPFLRKISKSIYYRPENGNEFIMNTSSFINGEEGINNHGLAVAMTFVKPKLDEIKPGFNSVFLVRYILEKCKTIDEGIDVLKRLPIASSCNILLADRNEKMVVVESNPLELNIRYPEKNKDGESFIITVNHFTSRKMRKHNASNYNIYRSETRYKTAYNALRDMDYIDGVKHAKNILSGEYGFMCQYDKKLDFDTIWSSIFDIKNLNIYIAEGNPLRAKFKEDKRLLKDIKNGAA